MYPRRRSLRRAPFRRTAAAMRALIAAACCVLLIASCGPSVLRGNAASMRYDPYRAGGLPAADGPSGPRADAGQPTGTVNDTDGGAIDRQALLAINDIEDFWKQNYSNAFHGTFTPVSKLLSYDSSDPLAPTVCGEQPYGEVNAFYCPPEDVMAWDRGKFMPAAKKFFGDMAINGLLGHEYGHAVQTQANIVDRTTPTLVREQQADCFSGVYLRWVAEGHSPRFTLSTGDGLTKVLAGAIYTRDPTWTPESTGRGHGTALDRVSAFQIGFDDGAAACAKIDTDEIAQRRLDLPPSLFDDPDDSATPSDHTHFDTATLNDLMTTLGAIFSPSTPPTLITQPASCPDAQPRGPASYCPSTNTINVDMDQLAKMGTPADENQLVLPQGRNTALSIVTSRYALAIEHQRGAALDNAATALRTACLTGVAQRKMTEAGQTGTAAPIVLGAADIDQAVAGLLTNGLAASDINGDTVPAGFTRILAYRSGLPGDTDLCFQRFS